VDALALSPKLGSRPAVTWLQTRRAFLQNSVAAVALLDFKSPMTSAVGKGLEGACWDDGTFWDDRTGWFEATLGRLTHEYQEQAIVRKIAGPLRMSNPRHS
jgi:hypothetical protein